MMQQLPELTAIQIRVLGSLMEKCKTTPEYYPMTLNAITAACNQKTSRKPVTNYSEEEVLSALNSLKAMSLVATAVGAGSRTIKYKHNFTTVYPLTDGELAIMCLLFLRGPQTPGELNTNSGRLHQFSSLESVWNSLQTLSSATIPFVKELSKQSGQKETRFTHLFSSSDVHQSTSNEFLEVKTESESELLLRVQKLEEAVEELQKQISFLKKQLGISD